MSTCDQEMCPNWSGDGNVCPCAVFGLERPSPGFDDLPGMWESSDLVDGWADTDGRR